MKHIVFFEEWRKLMGMKRYTAIPVLFASVCLGILAILPAVAEDHPTPPPVTIKTSPDGIEHYTLPKGSAFHVVLQTPLHTYVSQVNDPVEAILSTPIYLNDKVLFNKNTRVFGHIQRLELPIQGRNAVLEVHFDAVKLSSGEKVPMSAYVKTENPEHIWGGELTPGTVPKTVVHSVYGIGQYGQTVFTGPRMMGQHLEFLPGSYWIILLEEPLTMLRATDANRAW